MQSEQKSRIISEETAFEKKWLGISHITYSIGEKTVKNYQAVYRPQRKHSGSAMDGVQILPILKKSGKEPEIVFIANFRPAIGHFSVQFPAGLLQNNNYEENGLRQLQEETGYVAQKILKLPAVPIHCDPWKSNQAGMLYVAIINGDDPKHRKEQNLEKEENIRIFTLPINSKLSESLEEYATKNGYKIHTKVWTFCLGFNLQNLIPF